MYQRFFFTLSLLVMLAPLAQAQSPSIPEIRDGLAVYPATGLWWTPPTGDGRWGVQVEVQSGEAFPGGWMGATIYSYESGNPQRQAWYVAAQHFSFNSNWREDGYVARMNLSLQRTANGICLTCADGGLSGNSAASDVAEAEITFFDSLNGQLRVGDVIHPLVKAQWGDGVGADARSFWHRPFQIQAHIASTALILDGGFTYEFIDLVEPLLTRENARFRDVDGWDVYEFTARAKNEFVTIGGPMQEIVDADFELYSHAARNEHHLVFKASSAFVDIQLFPLSRYLIEGRSVQSTELYREVGQVLMMSAPSMQGPDGEPLPFPIADPE